TAIKMRGFKKPDSEGGFFFIGVPLLGHNGPVADLFGKSDAAGCLRRAKASAVEQNDFAPSSTRVDLCRRGCYVATPAHHEPELQRHAELTADRVSDEGEPCDARAGDAQGLGGDAPLPENSSTSSASNSSGWACSATGSIRI